MSSSDGLRPPIVTNVPEGFIELMKDCWHSDPKKRPTAIDILEKIEEMWKNELENYYYRNPTKIIKSSDIGPVAKNNPGAIYKSRPLSRMIHSAMSLRSSRSRSINTNLETDPFYYYQENNIASTDKRKFENDSVEDSNDDSQSIIKKGKLFKTKNSDYITKEIEIDININLDQPRNNEYITKELDIDINNL
ncbi:unnamed protein product [Rhizophagus irregularis]|nr:unnamed protein product [Rhizophagus irregularis]